MSRFVAQIENQVVEYENVEIGNDKRILIPNICHKGTDIFAGKELKNMFDIYLVSIKKIRKQ